MKYVKGMTVTIVHDYDLFGKNANGMTAVVLRSYSVNRVETVDRKKITVIKHLVYIKEIDDYGEPREEWLEPTSEKVP